MFSFPLKAPSARRPFALALVFALLATALALPSAAAAESTPICGSVRDAAGNPVASAQVVFSSAGRAIAGTLALAPGVHYATTTDANGRYALNVDLTVEYRGTASAPTATHGPIFGSADTTPVNTAFTPRDDCNGTAGFARDFVLPTPEQNLIRFTVADAITNAPLGTVNVRVPTGSTTTNADGVARTACFRDGSGTFTATFDKAGYIPAAWNLPCVVAATPEVALAVKLWRKPLRVVAAATDSTTDDGRTRIENPVTGALVTISQTPTELAGLQAFCGAPPRHGNATTNEGSGSPYACAGTTDASGTTLLQLPWSESGRYLLQADHASYSVMRREVEIRAASTEATTAPVAPAVAADAQAGPLQAGATRYERFSLQPALVTVSSLVTDIASASITGARISFDGPTKLTTTTNAHGYANVSLLSGAYTIQIDATGFNIRTCSLTLSTSGTWSGTTAATCFTLVHAEHAAVLGTVIDTLNNAPVAGLKLCIVKPCDAASAIATTAADGTYAFEVPIVGPSTSVTINATGLWYVEKAVTGLTRDAVAAAGQTNAARAKSPVTLRTVTAGAAAIPLAKVDVTYNTTGGTPVTKFTNVATNANGEVVLALEWTSRNGVADGSYTVSASRLRFTPSYDRATLALVDVAAGSAPTRTLTLRETPTTPLNVTVLDAHTGLPLAASVEARVTGQPTCWGATCNATTSPTGPARLHLYVNETYNVCVTGPTDFRSNVCTAATIPGDFVLNLTRNASASFVVTVQDAHTGKPVSGRAVEIKGAGFTCRPPGTTYTCSATTGTDGRATFASAPRVSGTSACYAIAAGSAPVGLVQSTATTPPTNVLTETATFQNAWSCTPIGTATTVKMLRAPSTLAGRVTSIAGNAPIADVAVTPTTERVAQIAAFVCNPAGAHGNETFPDCAGKTTDAQGNVALSLPSGTTQDHTWAAAYRKAKHHDENLIRVAPGPQALTTLLAPSEYTATVTFKETSVDGRAFNCSDAFENGPTVTFAELTGGTAPAPITAPLAKDGADCKATATLPMGRTNVRHPAGTPTNPKTTSHYLVTVAYGQNVSANVVELGPAKNTATVTITHNPLEANDLPVTLAGRLMDADATPAAGVPGATVTATRVGGNCAGSGSTFATTTDRDGAWTLAAGCPGTYALRYDSTLYEPKSSTITVGSSGRSGITNTLARVTTADLQVSVLDADNMPSGMAGVIITVTPNDTSGAAQSKTTTSASDSLAFDDLKWGSYTISWTPPAGSNKQSGTATLTVGPGYRTAYFALVR